jgi:hypothetical protein
MEEEGRKIMEYVIVAKENETTNPTDPRDILG